MKVRVRLSNGAKDKPWLSQILWDDDDRAVILCKRGCWPEKMASMRYIEPGISKAKYLRMAARCEEFDGDGVV